MIKVVGYGRDLSYRGNTERGKAVFRRVSLEAFVVDTDKRAMHREREKARALRQSQWWKRQLDRGRCHYCNRPFPPSALTMDHIVPVVRGGKSKKGNLVPACKDCNNKKKHMLPIEWEAYLRSLAENDTQ